MSAGAIAGLAGWWRPEGFALAPMVVILAGMAALSAGPVSRAWPTVRRAALGALAAFLPLAGLWLWFRVSYFGNVLPTSAVMKGHGFHPLNAIASALFYGLALLPLMVLLMIGRRGRRLPRGWWVLFVALAIMSSVWVLLDMSLNWWFRMQWPLFLVLAFLAITLATRGGALSHPRWKAIEVTAMFTAVVLCVAYFICPATCTSRHPLQLQLSPHSPLRIRPTFVWQLLRQVSSRCPWTRAVWHWTPGVSMTEASPILEGIRWAIDSGNSSQTSSSFMATAHPTPSTKKAARLLAMSAGQPWLTSCTRMLTQTASRLCARRRQLGATYGASLSPQTFPHRCGARSRAIHFKDGSLFRPANPFALLADDRGIGRSIGVSY
jgi:hypothetical protein